jgi:hypothetical protein
MFENPVLLGRVNGGVDILFHVKEGFWEGDIVVANSKNGTSLGEPLVIPQEYFYSLFGQEVKDFFHLVSIWRFPRFEAGGVAKKIPTPIPYRRCYRIGSRITFRFPAGSTIALRVDEKVEEAAKTILNREAEKNRLQSQRTIETAAYIQARKSGHSPGFSLL